MNYALIESEKVVNIIALLPSNASDFPNAVCCDGLSVGIGDDYINGVFYRNGGAIQTEAERTIDELRTEIADMKSALEILGVTE